MNIALFGGSFDPPHLGHAAVIRHLGDLKNSDKTLRFAEIWLIPTHIHAFGKKLLAFAERLNLCKILLQDLGLEKERYKVLDIERDFSQENRTIDTLRKLHHLYPGNTFTLVLGSDLKKELLSWKEAAKIPDLAQIYFIPRRGHETSSESAFAPNISSSEVRKKLEDGEEIHSWVTQGVATYIEKKRLYAKNLRDR